MHVGPECEEASDLESLDMKTVGDMADEFYQCCACGQWSNYFEWSEAEADDEGG